MFIKRSIYEELKSENKHLAERLDRSDSALNTMTKRHEEREKIILELENKLVKLTGKHDPKTGKFIKKTN